jgi:hypothetical protein
MTVGLPTSFDTGMKTFSVSRSISNDRRRSDRAARLLRAHRASPHPISVGQPPKIRDLLPIRLAEGGNLLYTQPN